MDVSVTPFNIKSTPSTLFQAIQTVPISLVLYFILQPAIFDNDKYVFFMDVIRYSGGYSQYPPTTLWDVVLFETILLTAVSVPLVSKMFADEARDLLKKEYVNVSKTLGASKWTQIRKHVLPELMPNVFVVWIQPIIQALLMIGQLGVLQLYFGGTDVIRRAMETDVIPRTNEWSGFIGYQYQNFGAPPMDRTDPACLLLFSYFVI
ncbi:ABC transporter permease subunit [Pullulanibacillus sp. KACC 23026]|uniref:ABC transporter permease subunit n=1 Tax=Pullulanibacillus sp. KACC 23026 TaxID=3028315 RepID=UPI0023B017E1|nr:ABC transporter permease subunit [Pullulanibacillus sp. KACC 23026]WEG14550.1 ABC transporter permease subunit [Pullulanibacillus sp. KACC 23026]